MATVKITVRQKRIVYDDSTSLTSFDGEITTLLRMEVVRFISDGH